jgi:hypothetical protein
MAITGKFGADFDDFYSAVQTAEAHLRSFESNSAKVESRLNAVTDALSGRKILQEATIATKAVEELGGVTTLTATEQAKLNKLLGDALTKYDAIGKDAPDDMKALYEATKSVEQPTEGLSAKALAFGTAVGTMAADAIKALGRLVVDGIGAVASAFADLVMEGADVDDIAGNFESLATSAGHVSSTLLGALRDATHNTISDFDLMQVANESLAAGVRLTDADFGKLATGAFNLANATGVDVKDALGQMSDAMITGQAKAVQLLTGKVDLESAERRYAIAIGKTRDELTPEQELEARRAALLDAVAAASARVGEQTDGIGEKVEQARARWDNFRAGLALSIAQSPVLVAGFDAIMGALERAFGDDQQGLIDAITSGINTGAVAAADFALAAIAMADGAASAFGALMVPIDAVIFGILDLVARTAEAQATMGELAASVPGVGAAFDSSAVAARGAATAWGEMRDQAQSDLDTAKALATGHGAVHDTLTRLSGAVGEVKASMEAARLSSQAAGSALDAHATSAGGSAEATRAAAAAAADEAAQLKKQEEALKAAAAAQKKMAEAMTELSSVGASWQETVAGLDQGVVDMAEAYLRAGANAGALQTALSLTDGQIKAITESIKAQDKATDASVKKQQEWAKAQTSAATDARALWDDYEKIRDQQTKTATDQQIAEVERWKRGMIAKYTDLEGINEDMYRAIEATAAAKLDAIRVDWQDLTSSSQTNLQQVADKALATYDEARTGHHNLTIEQIDNLERIAIAAQDAASGYATAFTGAATEVGNAMDVAADRTIAAARRIAAEPPAKLPGNFPTAGGVPPTGAYSVGTIGTPTKPAGMSESEWQLMQTDPRQWEMTHGYDWDAPHAGTGNAWSMLETPRATNPGGAGTTNNNVTVQVQGAMLGTVDQLARLVGDALVGRLRQQGVQLPASV